MTLDELISFSEVQNAIINDATLVDFEMRFWINKFEKSQIKDAALFSCIETSGKKIRPFLFLETLRILNTDTSKFISIAASIEMCHVYSLIHDDLPSLDNDDFRRGVPSCHKKFNEGTALLTGNSLLTSCFEIISSCKETSSEKRCLIIRKFAQAIGQSGMMHGQCLDIDTQNQHINVDTLLHIYDLKTGKLIRFSCLAAAILADATEAELESIDNFAYHFGILFQATDDLLDYQEKQTKELNIANVLGIAKAQKFVKEAFTKAVLSLDIFGDKANMLRSLAMLVLDRKK